MTRDLTLNRLQLQKLEGLVGELVDRIGDAAIVPPAAGQFDVTPHDYSNIRQTLKVDIDMGGLTLPLCASVFETHTDGRPDLTRLAGAIGARISDASRGRGAILDRLARARDAAERTATRVGARVIAVRIARDQTDRRIAAQDRMLEIDLEALDDALRPAIETLREFHGRAFRGDIAAREPQQRKRLARRARLGADEVIEVTAVAEAAIQFAGRTVGSVAADLLDAKECGQWELIAGTMWKDHIGVRLLDGLLVCSAMIPGVGYMDTKEIWISALLPEAVQIALRGRRLDRIAEHPVLQCDAWIAGSRTTDGNRTDFSIRSARRAVTSAEIGRGSLAAAA